MVVRCGGNLRWHVRLEARSFQQTHVNEQCWAEARSFHTRHTPSVAASSHDTVAASTSARTTHGSSSSNLHENHGSSTHLYEDHCRSFGQAQNAAYEPLLLQDGQVGVNGVHYAIVYEVLRKHDVHILINRCFEAQDHEPTGDAWGRSIEVSGGACHKGCRGRGWGGACFKGCRVGGVGACHKGAGFWGGDHVLRV